MRIISFHHLRKNEGYRDNCFKEMLQVPGSLVATWECCIVQLPTKTPSSQLWRKIAECLPKEDVMCFMVFVLFCFEKGFGEVVTSSGSLVVSAHSSLRSYSSRFQGMPRWMMATPPTTSFIMDLFCSVFHFSCVCMHACVCVVWVHTLGIAHLCACVGLRLMSGITLDFSSTLCIKSGSLCQTQSLLIQLVLTASLLRRSSLCLLWLE